MDALEYETYGSKDSEKYPLCSKVIERAEEEITITLAALATGMYLPEGAPMYSDGFDLGPEIFAGIGERGWTIGSVSKLPSAETKQKHSKLYHYMRHKDDSNWGCFDENTKVTRLALDDYWGDEVTVDTFDTTDMNNLTDKQTNIEDIDRGEFILASTAFALLDPRYQKDCWAEVKYVDESDLEYQSYENLMIITYNIDGSEKKVKLSADHPIYVNKGGKWEFRRILDSSLGNAKIYVGENKTGRIVSIEEEDSGNPEIYDLKTDVMSYYVGDSLLASNKP